MVPDPQWHSDAAMLLEPFVLDATEAATADPERLARVHPLRRVAPDLGVDAGLVDGVVHDAVELDPVLPLKVPVALLRELNTRR